MKAKLRQDIMEYLKKQGYEKDGYGDWYKPLYNPVNEIEENIDVMFTENMIISGSFDVFEHYTNKHGFTYQKDWLIFEDEIIQITQNDTSKEECLIEAVAEMKKDIDLQNDTIELNQSMILEVCLYMIEEHKKAMKPPTFRYLSFEDWIHFLKEKEEDTK